MATDQEIHDLVMQGIAVTKQHIDLLATRLQSQLATLAQTITDLQTAVANAGAANTVSFDDVNAAQAALQTEVDNLAPDVANPPAGQVTPS